MKIEDEISQKIGSAPSLEDIETQSKPHTVLNQNHSTILIEPSVVCNLYQQIYYSP
jgi:hypothetical protein|tara:strand:+ start:228 stop:395 length:168 start_codon:yes stop_codon:yes gene_type:complete